MNAELKIPPQSPRATVPTAGLAWLLGGLGVAAVPHAAYLPYWTLALFAGALVWRWMATAARVRLPSRTFLAGLTVVAAGTVSISQGLVFGHSSGTALLLVMTALKLLETHRLRDAMIVVFLGYLLIITYFFYAQDIVTALFLLISVVMLTAALQALNRGNSRPSATRQVRQSLRILGQSLPLALLLFALVPRLGSPLWSIPRSGADGVTGLSDTMAPGRISQLSQSTDVAFRVRFEGPVPEPRDRYWRGPVFWHYEDGAWSQNAVFGRASLQSTDDAALQRYTVTLKAHYQRWLFALDMPAEVPAGARISNALELVAMKPVDENRRYTMSSYTRYRAGTELNKGDRARALRLPADSEPRTRRQGAAWRAEGLDDGAIVQRALHMFREQPFVYTLRPGVLGDNPSDEFLFETRRGFCEHYASSFVILMRSAGVPARVVTGYQGGETNPVADYMIVRQSDAHAWAEVWLQGQGWVRVDPTAAVSPARIELGLHAAIGDASALPLLSRRSGDWFHRTALLWDAINNRWDEWVTGYGTWSQQRLLSMLGFEMSHWRDLLLVLALSLSGMTVLYLSLLLLRSRPAAPDAIDRAYGVFCRRLASRGLKREPIEGPLAYASRVVAQAPELANEVNEITRVYARLRYGPQNDTPFLMRRLGALVRGFRP